MCVGEKRKLKIPAKLGYGEQGSPPKIPGNTVSDFSCLSRRFSYSIMYVIHDTTLLSFSYALLIS